MKLLITGGRGMLGRDLVRELSPLGEIISIDLEECDITDSKQIHDYICGLKPDMVVHAAAYTHVDDCEKERDLAFAVNGDGAGNVARACRDTGAGMVYFSSDYIFDGTSMEPYTEKDSPNPLSNYGASKLEGELQVARYLPGDHLVLRTSWLFGVNGRNFVETLVRKARETGSLSVVDDQTGCPTYTLDLASATARLLRSGARGFYNVTNTGITTWYGFASYFLGRIVPDATVKPIPTSGYPLPAVRPVFFGPVTGKTHPGVQLYIAHMAGCR